MAVFHLNILIYLGGNYIHPCKFSAKYHLNLWYEILGGQQKSWYPHVSPWYPYCLCQKPPYWSIFPLGKAAQCRAQFGHHSPGWEWPTSTAPSWARSSAATWWSMLPRRTWKLPDAHSIPCSTAIKHGWQMLENQKKCKKNGGWIGTLLLLINKHGDVRWFGWISLKHGLFFVNDWIPPWSIIGLAVLEQYQSKPHLTI